MLVSFAPGKTTDYGIPVKASPAADNLIEISDLRFSRGSCVIFNGLGLAIPRGRITAIMGPSGTGKTTLARGIGRGWGTPLRVTSPTYVLVNEYPRPRDGATLYHIDCYRLERTADIATVGLEDILDGDAPALIEWPEHIVDLLPPDRLWITLTYDSPTRRRMRYTSTGEGI